MKACFICGELRPVKVRSDIQQAICLGCNNTVQWKVPYQTFVGRIFWNKPNISEVIKKEVFVHYLASKKNLEEFMVSRRKNI